MDKGLASLFSNKNLKKYQRKERADKNADAAEVRSNSSTVTREILNLGRNCTLSDGCITENASGFADLWFGPRSMSLARGFSFRALHPDFVEAAIAQNLVVLLRGLVIVVH